MARPDLNELTAFLQIATLRSFRKAADELGVSPSTLSHMMRTLEQNVGVRLLHRTTRSLSPTEAGERLLSSLAPVLRDLDRALREVDAYRQRPAGTLRLNASESAARVLLSEVVPRFLERYPEMSLDLVAENRLVDIVAMGFDAGVRLGDTVPQDMVAVRFGGAVRFLTVASPAYLARHPPPKLPRELEQHTCIRIRMPSGSLYQWEFEKDGEELSVQVSGPLLLDHLGLMAEAAVDGLGIAYVPDIVARPHLEAGTLVALLGDWCPVVAGLSLYYPGHRHVPPGLRAFIEVMKQNGV